jgi:DNA-directed RNA polymerase subunit RPC12/RpoP
MDPNLGRACNSDNRNEDPGGLYRCTKCNKAYQRPQDLKRHTRDKHVRQRKCPFCRTRWSRPERIRVHLVKKHEGRLTKSQQQEILSLRGRDDTIRYGENCGNATHHGNYTFDQLDPGNPFGAPAA